MKSVSELGKVEVIRHIILMFICFCGDIWVIKKEIQTICRNNSTIRKMGKLSFKFNIKKGLYVEWLRKKINLISKNNIDDIEEYKELNFQKLTPAKVEDMKYYKEALEFAFNDPDIKNIAVTGAYSAGKSSVIETYKSLNKDKKFINISLANFEKSYENGEGVEITNDEKNRKKQLKENLLEGKIINQIIHQIDSKRIQHTEFKVKKKVNCLGVLINTTLVTILTLLILYNIKFIVWGSIVSNLKEFYFDIFQHTIKNEFRLLSIGICISIIGFYLYHIIKLQLQGQLFKKIKLNNSEIEIFKKDDDSYFDKYLDEILYLFHNAKIDAVIFEDIDRYNDNSIFNELREINFLINNRANRKTNKEPIKFLYLIKDDIFISKDRTKFFDFIIPIVPVIDSSNSYDKILEYLEFGGILEQFDKNFLQRISLYVDDMRILKNVYNEYVIYSGRLQTTELELIPDKLLSIIMYKNIFPKDFIALQLNTGFVYNVFDNKSYYIERRIKEIDNKIEVNTEYIKTIKAECVDDIDELDALYLTGNYIVNSKYDYEFSNRVEYIKEIRKSDYIVINNGSQENIKSRFDQFQKDTEYSRRKKIIEQKMSDRTIKLEKENAGLRYEKSKLNSSKLQELIKEYNIDAKSIFKYNESIEDGGSFRFEDIIDNQYYPLIRYLIRNGYIDETYTDYLTYFYENSLSKRDKIFLRSVTDEITKEHSYKLDDVKTIISYLKSNDFEHKETLNFDLLDHLLQNEHQYLKTLLEQIRENFLFDFTWEYIVRASNINKFVKELNNVWRDLYKYLMSNADVSEEQRKTYLIYTLYYSSVEEIISMNIDDCITFYISNNKDFLEIHEPQIDLIIEKLISLNVRFIDINYDKVDKSLFSEVYRNNLYCINFDMITLILDKVYEIPYGADFKKKNYTLICSRPDESLKQYINNNLDKYIKVVLDNLEDEINDSEDSVVFILNNEDIESDDKLIYIENLSTVISDLCEVHNDYWEDLIKNSNVEYSEHNTLEYYFNYSGSIDSILINYLNNNSSDINFNYDNIAEDYGEKKASEFFIDVIKNKELINQKYKMILEGYQNQIDEFKIEGIEDDKIEILIQLSIIGMTKENIEFIRANHPNSIISFICSDIQEYIDCLDEGILDEDEVLELLKEPVISDQYKIGLLEKYPNNISLIDSNYSEKVQAFIIQNNFDENDLDLLIKNYDRSSSYMQDVIKDVCIVNIGGINNKKCILSYKLLEDIISSRKIEGYHKKIIIYNNLDKLRLGKVKEYLSKAGFNDLVELLEGKRPKILKTKENYDLLEYFRNKGWISSYREDTNDPSFYQTFGRRHIRTKKEPLDDELL